MRKLASPIVRLTLALLGITLALLMSAVALRILPDAQAEALAHRKRTVEALTVQLSSPVMLQDIDAMAEVLDSMVQRGGDVRTAALRAADGQLLLQSGDHERQWQKLDAGRSTAEFVSVPIFAEGEQLASIEVHFNPLPSPWELSLSHGGIAALLLFVAVGGALGYFLVLRRSLKALDPSAVIPERVRMVMDSLVEGVIVMDERQNILLANRAFAAELGVPMEQLAGKPADLLNWRASDTGGSPEELPWAQAMRTRLVVAGQTLALRAADDSLRTFTVNCTPVLDPKGRVRGAFASFDDVTQLQQQNSELQTTLAELQASRESVERNNAELRYLATRDPLTGCLNRRAFFAAFEKLFAAAQQRGRTMYCAMMDIDHFKQINDKFGHGTGDRVIAYVAETIRLTVRESDVVGRYGGEEYCIVFPDCTAGEAMAALERIREAVIRGAASRFTSSLRLTISGGCAELRPEDRTGSAVIDRADVALYSAKNSGRNRVVQWHEDIHRDVVNETRSHRSLKPELTGKWQGMGEGAASATAVQRLAQMTANDIFRERVTQALALAARHSWTSALLRIEFETAGLMAPRAATEVLERIASLLRRSDTIALMHGAHLAEGDADAVPSIAPLSATELGVLLPDVADVKAVGRVVQRIVSTVAEPVIIDDSETFTTCSIGISVAPADGEDFETLMQRADHAKRVTRSGRNGERYAFYQQSMTDMLLHAMRMESGLRRALLRNEFQIVYQPQVSILENEVCAFEALLRWTTSEGKVIPPDQFIPVAEASGLIGSIGDWVLRAACEQVLQWQRAGGLACRVAVNVSAVQIMSPGFAERVTTIIKDSGVDPRLVELEITETAFMSNLTTAAATLRELRRMGLHIALDDFGTGYSSLSYLKQLPIDSVKIDSRFVRDLNDTREGVALVAAIVGMAHGLGIRVVAEGVETPEVMDALRDLGCDQAQGYLISGPVSGEAAGAMLHASVVAAPTAEAGGAVA